MMPPIFRLSMLLPVPAFFIAISYEPVAGQTATGTGRAHIVQPLSVTAQRDLSFGAIAVSATGDGTVTVSPTSGAPAYRGGARAVCVDRAGCRPHPATFRVNGEPGRTFAIDLPGSVFARALSGAGPDLEVDTIMVISSNRKTTDSTGALDNEGSDMLFVGGTLRIPAATESGRYSAAIQMVVRYD